MSDGPTDTEAEVTPERVEATSGPDFSRRIVTRRGEVVEFDTPEQAAEALARTDASGEPLFTPDTPEARTERIARRTYGDRPLAAGAAGAASGATLGLSDAAGSALGFGEDLEGLRRYNEGATVLGEVVGSVAPVLLAGPLGAAGEIAEGGSLLARGGRLLTAPTRAVAGLAEAGGTAVGGLVRGAGTSATRRLAGSAARLGAEGAIEGAASEAGRLITEEALGDPNLTAESVLARLGTGMLLGGATGGILGAGGGVVAEGVRASRRAASGAADLLRRTWGETVGTELSPTVARAWALASGADPADLGRVLSMNADGRRIRALGARGEAVFDDGTREVARALDVVERGRAHATDFWSRGLKREQVVDRVATGRLMDQATVASGAFTRARDFTRRVMNMPGDYAANTIGLARRLDTALQARESMLARALDAGDTADAAADVFQSMDLLKREIGRLRTNTNIRGSAAAPELDDLYEGLRTTLERTDLWGEAAEMQRRVNSAFTTELGSRQAFVRRFLGGDGMRDDIDPFRALSTADTRVINGFLRQAGTVANETAEGTFEQTLQSTRELLRVMDDALDLPANVRRDVAAALAGSDNAIATFGRARQDAIDLNQWRRVMSSSDSTSRAVVAGAAGSLAAGPLGGAVAAALSSPSVAIRALGTVERLAAGAGDQMQDAVRGFLRGAAETGTRAARAAARRGRLAATTGLAAYQARVKELDEQRDPRTAARNLAARVDGLEAAPAVRSAVLATATRARSYLEANRPRPRTLDGQIRPDTQATPSPEEIARFLRIARAVDNPMSVLADLRSGDITPEAVEALRQVYPQLYEQMRQTVVREMARSGGSVGYDRRISLGVLFGVPTDPALTPRHMAITQAMYAAQTPTAPPPSSRSAAPDIAAAGFSGTDALAWRTA